MKSDFTVLNETKRICLKSKCMGITQGFMLGPTLITFTNEKPSSVPSGATVHDQLDSVHHVEQTNMSLVQTPRLHGTQVVIWICFIRKTDRNS